jgi:hypothetical protein
MSSDYEVALMTEADIPGAIDAIQQAFTEDPYSKWIYNDRSKVRSSEEPSSSPQPKQISRHLSLTIPNPQP